MPKPWISKTIRGLLHASWILLASLIAVEIILNIFDPLGLEFYSDAGEYFRSKILHTEHGFYINRPGDRYILSNTAVSINSEGFRDDEFSIKKPDETIRVLCIGDSLVFGWGAPQDSLFPVVLEKMAKEEGFSCEVIAAGAPSWNTPMEFNFLRLRGKLYKPDILLLLVVGNDLLAKENTAPRRWDTFNNMLRGRTGTRHSYLVRTFLHFQNKFLAGTALLDQFERDPTIFDEVMSATQGIISLCKTNTIRPLVFLGVGENDASDFNKMYKNLYASELEKLGITAHVCTVSFSDHSLRISSIDAHPTALGHELIAQAMYPELRSILVELTGKEDHPASSILDPCGISLSSRLAKIPFSAFCRRPQLESSPS